MKWKRTLALLLIALLSVILAGPFLLPLPPAPTADARSLADPDSRWVAVDGLTVHYKQAGSGEPALVLLHGFAASTFSWREQLAHPDGLGRLYAFDRPAFGLTDRPLQGDYSPEAQADLIIGLLDRWGVDRAVLVGNSAGGTVALTTALRHPTRVQALVLVDAAVYAGGGAPPFVKPLLRTAWGRRLGLHITRRFTSFGASFLESAWYDPSLVTAEIRAGYQRPAAVKDADRALWEFTLQSRAATLADQLGQVRQPVLVITGAEDRIVPAAQSMRLAAALPDARLVVLAQCGHLPHEECPVPFSDALRAFVAELAR